MEDEHRCILCEAEREYDTPCDLCEKHWLQWFMFIIEFDEEGVLIPWCAEPDADEWYREKCKERGIEYV